MPRGGTSTDCTSGPRRIALGARLVGPGKKLTLTSKVIESDAADPFHAHSRTPPVREIGSEMPRGAA